MPARNGKGNGNANDNFAAALTEVSDRLSRLVQDEIELAKAEVAQKATSLARGAAAVAAGAVFGVFAVVFFLLTLAWVIDGIFVSGAGSLWLGFLVVLVVLVVLTGGAFMFAWKKLSVGAPTPKMAISEGKKIKDTVTAFGNGHTPADPGLAPVGVRNDPVGALPSTPTASAAVGAAAVKLTGPVPGTAPESLATPGEQKLWAADELESKPAAASPVATEPPAVATPAVASESSDAVAPVSPDAVASESSAPEADAPPAILVIPQEAPPGESAGSADDEYTIESVPDTDADTENRG